MDWRPRGYASVDEIRRVLFWQIEAPWLFYSASALATGCCAVGLWRKIRWIRQGARVPAEGLHIGTIGKVCTDILLHAQLRNDRIAGISHILLFYSFLTLLMVTTYVMIAGHLAPRMYAGIPYVGISIAADGAGTLMLIGVGLALYRRAKNIRSKDQISPAYTSADTVLLTLLGFLSLSGLGLEGLRIHVQSDPWVVANPVGWLFSLLFAGIPAQDGVSLFRFLWWMHALTGLVMIAVIPFSNLLHMFTVPANLLTRNPAGSVGCLRRTDLASLREGRTPIDTIGMGFYGPADLTWRHRLELLSCMRCGRCRAVCPAFLCGQPLSPLALMSDLKHYAMTGRHLLLAPDNKVPDRFAGLGMSTEAFWVCRLCRSCETSCPAAVRHTNAVMELRRSEVMAAGRLPPDAAHALRCLSRTGNPYNSAPHEKDQWIRDYKIPTSLASPRTKGSVLLWPGCLSQADDVKTRVLIALTRLLSSLRIPYALFSHSESCCGEPARTLGDEDLFQALAQRQIARIQAAGAETILVHCPHCYTMLKDEYPSLGASFSVVHTSVFFRELLQKGRLRLNGHHIPSRIAFHDPCFLGRYHGLYDPPRDILCSLPGTQLLEPPCTRERSFCCGAGGGHFFMDLDLGERPSRRRFQELVSLGIDVVSVSCTFCAQMFEDAQRVLVPSPPVRIADWVELLAHAALGER